MFEHQHNRLLIFTFISVLLKSVDMYVAENIKIEGLGISFWHYLGNIFRT